MEFATAHKLTSYLMVAFAMAGMTAGGGIAPPFAIAGFMALAGSWFYEPRDPSWRSALVWTVASLGVLLYCAATALLTGDFLGVGAQFLLWLTITKAFNRRTARDWQQLYLLAVLMLVAGSVLNTDLSYGVSFLGFVICSTWAVTLLHLRREIERNAVGAASSAQAHQAAVRRILASKRVVERRFFVITGLISVCVFLGAAVAFLALPRVGLGFMGRGKTATTMAGFSDGVKLGGHGVIQNDPTVMMRVAIAPQWGNPQAPPIYWRGIAFDQYRMGQWFRSRQAPATRATQETIAGRVRRTLLYQDPPLPADEITALQQRLVAQTFYLEPFDTDVMFAGGLPRVYEWGKTGAPQQRMRERNDEVRLSRTGTLVYQAWSQLEKPPLAALRAASSELPNGFEVYLQLPEEITARTRELAQTITANTSNQYDRAQAIVQWLQTNLTYTREQAEPGTQEAVDFFLFTRKRGHCEYFASAFVVLARAAGIPARNVNGFLGGEWNGYENYVAVRGGDAHSWAEVYFSGVGWVTFDATPSGVGATMAREDNGLRAKLRRFMDSLRFGWNKWVIEYDLSAQLGLFRDTGRAVKRWTQAVATSVVQAGKTAAQRGWPYAVGLGVLAALAGLIWFLRQRPQRRARAAASVLARQQTAATALYEEAVQRFASVGLTRQPSQTPSEFLQTVTRAAIRPTMQQHFAVVTQAYHAARWGNTAEALPALAAAVQQLRAASFDAAP